MVLVGVGREWRAYEECQLQICSGLDPYGFLQIDTYPTQEKIELDPRHLVK